VKADHTRAHRARDGGRRHGLSNPSRFCSLRWPSARPCPGVAVASSSSRRPLLAGLAVQLGATTPAGGVARSAYALRRDRSAADLRRARDRLAARRRRVPGRHLAPAWPRLRLRGALRRRCRAPRGRGRERTSHAPPRRGRGGVRSRSLGRLPRGTRDDRDAARDGRGELAPRRRRFTYAPIPFSRRRSSRSSTGTCRMRAGHATASRSEQLSRSSQCSSPRTSTSRASAGWVRRGSRSSRPHRRAAGGGGRRARPGGAGAVRLRPRDGLPRSALVRVPDGGHPLARSRC
jgi:hypothetical protein